MCATMLSSSITPLYASTRNTAISVASVTAPVSINLAQSNYNDLVTASNQVYDLSKLTFEIVNAEGTKQIVDASKVTFALANESAGKGGFVGSRLVLTTDIPAGSNINISVSYQEADVIVTNEFNIISKGGNTATEQVSVSEVYLTAGPQQVFKVSKDQTLNLANLDFTILLQDGRKQDIKGSDLEFSVGLDHAKYVDINDSKVLSFTSQATTSVDVPVKATYTRNGASVNCTLTVKYVESANEALSGTPSKLYVGSQSNDLYELEYRDDFDLRDIEFVVKYEDGTQKVVVAEQMDSITIARRDQDLADIDKFIFEFTRYAEEGDEVDVTFTYKENGKTVSTVVTFELVEEGTTIVNKKIDSIEEKEEETHTLIAGEKYDLKKASFILTYENGATRTIKGSEIESDNIRIASGSKSLISVDSSKRIYFKDTAEVGDTASVTVYYETDNKTVKTTLEFELVESNGITINTLKTDYSRINAKVDETVNLKDIVFYYYSSSTKKEEVKVPQVSYSVASSDKSKVSIDTKNHTIKLVKDKVKINDTIPITFSYKIDGSTKKVTINLVCSNTSSTIGTSKPNPPVPTTYLDIQGHWAASSILNIAHKGIMAGNSGNYYFPSNNVSRGEVASFIARYLELNETAGTVNPFNDITYNQYSNDILQVYEKGLIAGYEDGTFRPNTFITREELATILVRTYKYKHNLQSLSPATTTFNDQSKISSWAVTSVMQAKQAGLIGGKPNNLFDPKANTTRAEMAELMYRMCF